MVSRAIGGYVRLMGGDYLYVPSIALLREL